ncbi:sulfatase-like hydrolase/transferase [Berryella intestinalis]|nr:sulfatase-like hydrolase/transferase [Berryella intestinalis]
MNRRFALIAFDAAGFALTAFVLTFAFTQPAWAYVDPSVMTYTIQALAGVAVALSTVMGVLMRRTRKKLLRALNVDENRNKEVEANVSRIDPNTGKPVASSAAAPKPRRTPKRSGAPAKGYAPAWTTRLVLSLLVSLFSVGTLLIVAPLEIVAASKGSLTYGLTDVWQPVVLSALALTAALTAFLTVLRGRAFNLLLMLVFSLGLGCWVQAMFLNHGLPAANGGTVKWTDYKTIGSISAIVWALIVAVPFMLSSLKRQATQFVCGALCAALIIVQTVAVASLFAPEAIQKGSTTGDGDSSDLSEYLMSEEGLFDVSSKHNVVFFVLDTYDTQFAKDSLAKDPAMFDELSGFTWFDNSVGSMIPTRYGNVFLLTGTMPQEGQRWGDFLATRYQNSSYLSDIQNLGYSIGIYSDTLGQQHLSAEDTKRLIYDRTINIRPTTESTMDVKGSLIALAQCALYRDMPWFGKPFFWFYTDEINQRMSDVSEAKGLASIPYVMNDAKWGNDVNRLGVKVNDANSGEAGSFRYIHMTGTHWPYNVNEKGEDIGLYNATLDQQTRGITKIVSDYIRKLKENGTYDNTTIVITADHGDYYPITGPLDKPTSPIVMVKPAQSAELDSQPMKVNHAPIWAGDILPTVIKSMGGDATKYGPTLFDIPEDQPRERFYLETINNDTGDVAALQYAVNGDALDMNSWQLTGKEWRIWE